MRGINEILSDSFNENPFVPALIDIICPSLSVSSKLSEVDLSQICFVIEFIDTDLDQLLKHKIDFSEYHMIKIIYNTLCSLSYIHSINVIHRDIKPANILISQDCNVKICDFGLSRSLNDHCNYKETGKNYDTININSIKLRKNIKNQIRMGKSAEQIKNSFSEMLIADRSRRKEMKRVISLHVGSRWYRAPEISLVEKSYDQSADLWSLGCIIYELLMYISFTGNDEKFKTDFQKARYLFQGNSCFPLSPFGKKEKGEKDEKGRQHTISKND